MHKTLLIFLLLLFALNVCAQEPNRLLIYDRLCNERASESEDDDSDCLLELIDIQIDGKRIESGKPFFADENWLKNLKIKVKNVSGKPLVAIGISFGLMEGLDEELAPSASWKWGLGFFRGKFSNLYGKTKVSRKVTIKPNEEIEFTSNDIPDLYKQSLNKHTFSKAVFVSGQVQFINGRQKDSPLFIKSSN